MKVKDIAKLLATTDSYATTRAHISDDVVAVIKNHAPLLYDIFKDKEELYQEMLSEAGELKQEFIDFLKELKQSTTKED